jgi:DNA/RNA endonuclease YhcR with UshA esterase domain
MIRKLVVFALLGVASSVFGDDAPKKEDAPVVIQASDKSAIDAAKDKDATVEGTVSEAAWSKSGKVMVIKFEDTKDSNFSAAVFQRTKDEFDKAFDGDAAKALTGAKVQLTGKVGTFRDNPQIILNKPSQVKVISKADGATKDKPAEKTEPKQ